LPAGSLTVTVAATDPDEPFAQDALTPVPVAHPDHDRASDSPSGSVASEVKVTLQPAPQVPPVVTETVGAALGSIRAMVEAVPVAFHSSVTVSWTGKSRTVVVAYVWLGRGPEPGDVPSPKSQR
jgi:hypothetical protein